jgi:hypothetical protein
MIGDQYRSKQAGFRSLDHHASFGLTEGRERLNAEVVEF